MFIITTFIMSKYLCCRASSFSIFCFLRMSRFDAFFLFPFLDIPRLLDQAGAVPFESMVTFPHYHFLLFLIITLEDSLQ